MQISIFYTQTLPSCFLALDLFKFFIFLFLFTHKTTQFAKYIFFYKVITHKHMLYNFHHHRYYHCSSISLTILFYHRTRAIKVKVNEQKIKLLAYIPIKDDCVNE